MDKAKLFRKPIEIYGYGLVGEVWVKLYQWLELNPQVRVGVGAGDEKVMKTVLISLNEEGGARLWVGYILHRLHCYVNLPYEQLDMELNNWPHGKIARVNDLEEFFEGTEDFAVLLNSPKRWVIDIRNQKGAGLW